MITESEIDKAMVEVSGYPAKEIRWDREGRINAEQWRFEKSGRVFGIDEKKGELKHTLATEAGHSGAPIIWKRGNGALKIIGIHKGVAKENEGG